MRIGRDKLEHVLVGYLIAVPFAIHFGPVVAIFSSLVVGILIEVVQAVTKTGKAEGADAFATVAGGMIAAMIWGMTL